MRKALLIVFLAIVISTFCFADNKEIEEIRKIYLQLKQLQPILKKETRDMSGYSTEGGEAAFYLDGRNRVCIIETLFYGESGKMREEFYFNSNILIFVLKIEEQYNSPIYTMNYSDEELKESDMEKFDPKKSIISESRFYFKDKKLIQILKNAKGKDVTPDLSDESVEAKNLLEYSEEIRNKFYTNKSLSQEEDSSTSE